MSKFEIDDSVEIINVNFLTKHERSTFNVKIGDKGKIIGFYKPSPVFAIVANNNFTNSNAGEGKLFVPVSSLQKLNSFYLESNRYKLTKAIKLTGFHAEKLSLASNHAKTYFTGFTAESRFNSRGDITEERLNSLLTTLAFAERELLGVGAKTVDDTIPKADEKGEVFTPYEKKALDNIHHDCIDPDWKATQYWEKRNEPEKKLIGDGITDEVDSIQREINSNKLNEPESSSNKVIVYSDNLKPILIAFLFVVLLLALWFLFK